MKTIFTILGTVLITISFSTKVIAQDSSKTNTSQPKNNIKSETDKKVQHGLGFVDADGDGYNDNAPDHDGDGIPNGLDPDYKNAKKRRGFVDLDGDGINDNLGFGNGKGIQMKGSGAFGNKGVGSNQGDVNGIGNDGAGTGGAGNKGPKGKGKNR